VKSGLENMLKLNTLLNNPLHNIPIIHVTGTNGKGSVSLKIAKSLRESGIKTGIFTSPHISSFKERIMVNEDQLSEADVEVSWSFTSIIAL
jgi:dihydrofolate synthase/folylpolyglutamate synthase